MITKKQKQVLDFVKRYYVKHDYAPSLEEIKKKFKFASVSTAHYYIKRLQDEGFLNKKHNHPRSISLYQQQALVHIPLLGQIAAGQPIEAIQNKEMIAVPQDKVANSKNVYALRVVGDSMIEENINDGDVVLVKHQETAENGQKVVALVDNQEATLKKYYRERGRVRLQPANQSMEPIIIRKDQDFKIQGVVLDVVKNLNPDIEVEEEYLKDEEQLFKKPKKIPVNSIILGDVLITLKNIPDKSIDLVLADPPYNLSKGNTINFQNNGLKGFGGKWNKVMEDWDNLPFADYFNFTYEWLHEIKRVLKPTGSVWVFGTYHNIGLINTVFQLLEVEIINEVIWYKRNAFPNLAGRRLTASHETLLWAHAGNGKRNYCFDYQASKDFFDKSDQLKERGKQMRTVWDIPNNKEKEELKFGKHPTQKPLRVCRRIVQISSKPGDVVLAPFAGAGSECVAAKELGRKYIGIEIEKEYADIAQQRLAATNQIKTLFD
jgi:SOS regulatory protein LexA